MCRGYLLDNRQGRYAYELPPHPVALSAIWMGANPVTIGLSEEYVSHNCKHRMPDAPEWGWMDERPMVTVNRLDIIGKNGINVYLN